MARGSHGFRQVPETRRFTGTGPFQRCQNAPCKAGPIHPVEHSLVWHRTATRASLARVEGVPPARNEVATRALGLAPSVGLHAVCHFSFISQHAHRLPGTAPSVHADSARRQSGVGGSSRTARAGSCVHLQWMSSLLGRATEDFCQQPAKTGVHHVVAAPTHRRARTDRRLLPASLLVLRPALRRRIRHLGWRFADRDQPQQPRHVHPSIFIMSSCGGIPRASTAIPHSLTSLMAGSTT